MTRMQAMQRAFNTATVGYKARVGDCQAWSDFYTWWEDAVGACDDGSDVNRDRLESMLKRLADKPELLVCGQCSFLGLLDVKHYSQ